MGARLGVGEQGARLGDRVVEARLGSGEQGPDWGQGARLGVSGSRGQMGTECGARLEGRGSGGTVWYKPTLTSHQSGMLHSLIFIKKILRTQEEAFIYKSKVFHSSERHFPSVFVGMIFIKLLPLKLWQ